MLPVLNRTDIQMSDLDVVVATIIFLRALVLPLSFAPSIPGFSSMSPESIIRRMTKVEAQFG